MNLTVEQIIADELDVPLVRIKPEAHLKALGADSLALMKLMIEIEDYFHLPQTPNIVMNRLKTVGDVVEYVRSYTDGTSSSVSDEAKDI